MNRPRLFISAVSEELRTARKEVAATVRTVGFDPVSQDDFPTGYGELRNWLREQIQSCDGIIQLVGRGYGAEPPEADPDFGRISYTQYEFLCSSHLGKKTWVVVIGEGFGRDKPVDQLDRPLDADHPDLSTIRPSASSFSMITSHGLIRRTISATPQIMTLNCRMLSYACTMSLGCYGNAQRNGCNASPQQLLPFSLAFA